VVGILIEQGGDLMHKTGLIFVLALVLGAFAHAANAATIINSDGEAYMLVVTESGQQTEIGVGAGETKQLCAGGCFLTLPNGDREALSGTETIEIKDGKANIR
jgi:hypothetical protein